MEAIAFSNGEQFAVASVEVLSRHTSHFIETATDQHDRTLSIHVEREQFELRLSMPRADVPLHTGGILTFGELALRTAITEIQPDDNGMIAHAVGIRDRHSLPEP